ncbi:hypothetical protein TNCV_2640021 [Trichonephila clavipes]|nr:hypothetical protein TNCV_2640021 [Trichonephila clavipes]
MYFSRSKTFMESSCHGPRSKQSSSITQQSCDNFSLRISDSDWWSQHTSGIGFSCSKVFKVRPCQGKFKIRLSGIIQQSYGYFGDSIRNLDSTPRDTPGIDFSCTLAYKIRFRRNTRIPTFCAFSRFPESTHFW